MRTASRMGITLTKRPRDQDTRTNCRLERQTCNALKININPSHEWSSTNTAFPMPPHGRGGEEPL